MKIEDTDKTMQLLTDHYRAKGCLEQIDNAIDINDILRLIERYNLSTNMPAFEELKSSAKKAIEQIISDFEDQIKAI